MSPRPLLDAIAITVVRFLLMLATLEIAPSFGIDGWSGGLATNAVVTLYAVALMTHRRLWRRSGFLTGSVSLVTAVALLPFVLETLLPAFSSWPRSKDPGFALWGTTILLAALNEELISRGVILDRLRHGYRPFLAVSLTGVLFGLQHLSQFALTSRSADDILVNVLASGIYGFALAAYQERYRWLWPLVAVHALSNFFTILAQPLPDPILYLAHAVLLGYGILLPRRHRPLQSRLNLGSLAAA